MPQQKTVCPRLVQASQPSVSTLAAKRFGGYTPERDRTPDLRSAQEPVVGRLRQFREALKETPPEAVFEMMGPVEFHRNLSMFQALELAKRTGKLLMPNTINHVFTGYGEDDYEAWTGTVIIFERPGVGFGDYVYYYWYNYAFWIDYAFVFTVPDMFRGKRNCALVVEHPDFDLVYLGDRIYELQVHSEGDIHLIENSPKQGGRYQYEPDFGIPVRSNSEFLAEIYPYRENSPYIGFLVHTENIGTGYKIRGVTANSTPLERYDVALIG